MPLHITKVRAPELTGRGWLNTGDKDLNLADLRGKIVVLDFWTFCCANCLHVLDELRPVEEQFADVLVVIGVHSPKFAHERDAAALAAAVERYGVEHPVLDDPELTTWRQYAARAWPTLAVIDPEGYLVASMAGEGHADRLAQLIEGLITEHRAKGTLRQGSGPYLPPPPASTQLRFPGKAVALPGGTLLVSDSTHHSLVELAADAQSVLRRFGDRERGWVDGKPETARFNEPQGLCLLPPDVAAAVGYDVVIADTVNHLLRGLNLNDGNVTTVAGTGRQWRMTADTDDARSLDLSSPWDVAWYDGRIIVAMAGIHQLWWFDPVKQTAGTYAGTTTEALRDGALPGVWLAQPSGLAVDGERLWFVDSETSALRYIADGRAHTVVGRGLFDFGLVDGPGDQALMQHPLGLTTFPDGSVIIADTYNGAIRRFDPTSGELTTVATGLAEPSDVLVVEETVLVVESAAHRLTALAPGAVTHNRIDATAARFRTERPVTYLASGSITLDIAFVIPDGQKLDDSFGPPIQVSVDCSPAGLLASGDGDGHSLTRELVLGKGEGVLTVIAQVATCDSEAEHPACQLSRQDWGIPFHTVEGATRELTLPLFQRV